MISIKDIKARSNFVNNIRNWLNKRNVTEVDTTHFQYYPSPSVTTSFKFCEKSTPIFCLSSQQTIKWVSCFLKESIFEVRKRLRPEIPSKYTLPEYLTIEIVIYNNDNTSRTTFINEILNFLNELTKSLFELCSERCVIIEIDHNNYLKKDRIVCNSERNLVGLSWLNDFKCKLLGKNLSFDYIEELFEEYNGHEVEANLYITDGKNWTNTWYLSEVGEVMAAESITYDPISTQFYKKLLNADAFINPIQNNSYSIIISVDRILAKLLNRSVKEFSIGSIWEKS